MILETKRCRLLDIANVERAKSGVVYPAGTIHIQVSATHGQIKMLKAPGIIEGKYATIIPKVPINQAYFKIALERSVPEFLAKYQTTINIQMGEFAFFDIEIHPDMKTQAEIAAIMKQCECAEELEQDIIDHLKTMKKIALSKMMC